MFSNLNAGSYFNMSNALLRKFSIFGFKVSSPKCSIYKLNAADVVLFSKKHENLNFQLKNHAFLNEIDG